jgi:hypothetical protein
MTSRRQLYAAEMPFGDSATRHCAGRVIYGGGGGGGGKSTTSQGLDPRLYPLVDTFTSQAQQVANTPFQAYGGQRFAGMNADQTQALDMIRQQSGSGVQGQAEGALGSFLQGGQENPYLTQQIQQAQNETADAYNRQVRPNQVMQAQQSGSFGNANVMDAQAKQDSQLQQNLGNIASSMRFNAYNTDQSNKMQALGLSPSIQQAGYTNAGQLLNAGNLQQNQAQDQADFGYQQFQEQQNDPYKKLQAMSGVFGTPGFQTQTTTQSGGGK